MCSTQKKKKIGCDIPGPRRQDRKHLCSQTFTSPVAGAPDPGVRVREVALTESGALLAVLQAWERAGQSRISKRLEPHTQA